MAVLSVEQPADALRHDGAYTLNDVWIIAHDHADGLAVITQNFFQFRQVNILQVFVTVYDQYPVIGGLLDGEISGSAEIITPGEMKYFLRIFLRNLYRSVHRTCIYYNDFEFTRTKSL